MKRAILLFLMLLVLLAPLVARRFAIRAEIRKAAPAPARLATPRLTIQTGIPNATSAPAPIRLVIITPNGQDIRREFARAFSDWYGNRFYQTVDIDYRTPGGTNDMVRLLTTSYDLQRIPPRPDGALPPEDQVRADIDIAWGGGDYTFYHDLKGLLQPIQLPDDPKLLSEAFPDPKLAGVRLYDDFVDPKTHVPAPRWIGGCLSSFGIVYNPELYATMHLAPPTRWQDLADPRLAGWVALADPTKSGSAAVAYEMVLQRAMADAEDVLRQSGAPLDKKSPQYQQKIAEVEAGLKLRGGALDKRSSEYTRAIADAEDQLRKSGAPLDKDDPRYRPAIADGWHRGMGQLLLIAANARYLTDSGTDPPNDVGNAEAAAGVAIDYYGRTYEQQIGSNRVRFVAPHAATAINPDAVAIMYGVRDERQLAARRFIEFLLTRQGQLLWILKRTADGGGPDGPRDRALHRAPIRRDLYAAGVDRSAWADAANPFDDAGNFNQRGEWMAPFADTRPIWAAAWIDSRDDLQSAYARVLAVADPVRRQNLLDRLADLPVALPDVDAMRGQRSDLEKQGGDVKLWMAQTRQHWAEVFRAHYSAVRAACGE